MMSIERWQFIPSPRYREAGYQAANQMASGRLQSWIGERAGFYRELPDYFRGLKKTAIQEILYGESVAMIVFAVYTYVYSISPPSVLLVTAGSFVLAGYHIRSFYA
jgi:hypothetical protein